MGISRWGCEDVRLGVSTLPSPQSAPLLPAHLSFLRLMFCCNWQPLSSWSRCIQVGLELPVLPTPDFLCPESLPVPRQRLTLLWQCCWPWPCLPCPGSGSLSPFCPAHMGWTSAAGPAGATPSRAPGVDLLHVQGLNLQRSVLCGSAAMALS